MGNKNEQVVGVNGVLGRRNVFINESVSLFARFFSLLEWF